MADLNRWQLDKHVPVAVILAVVVQTGSILWWGAKVDSRVAAIEEHIRKEEIKSMAASLPDRMARIEVQQKYTYDLVKEVLQELRNKRKREDE